ncbi:MAG: hypothetical protein ACQETO_06075 [Pseudomonadota bacterium]
MRESRGCRWLSPVALLLIAACATPDPLSVLPSARERMIAQISDDGSKFFEFNREHVTDPRRREQGPLPEEVLTRRVEDVLAETGYCRDGFFELYRQSVSGGLTLRGECREGVSETDRMAFPDGGVIYARDP